MTQNAFPLRLPREGMTVADMIALSSFKPEVREELTRAAAIAPDFDGQVAVLGPVVWLERAAVAADLADREMIYDLTEPPAGRWSSPIPIPAIGTRVRLNFNSLGEGTVVSYFREFAYVGVTVKLDDVSHERARNMARLKLPADTPALAFGCEVEAVAPAQGNTVRLLRAIEGDNADRFDGDDQIIPGEPETIHVPAGTLGTVTHNVWEGATEAYVTFDIPGHDGWSEWVVAFADLEVMAVAVPA